MSKPVIMVVDDDPLVLRLLKTILERDYEVLAAADPAAALALLEGNDPQLFILDMQLPGMHGLDLVHLLRGSQLTPAIAVTGGNVDSDEVLAHGFNGYLLKPFKPAELRALVANSLG